MSASKVPLFVEVVLALIAFAANSILCRLALRSAEIDPASFASIRLASGALVLAVLVRARSTKSTRSASSPSSPPSSASSNAPLNSPSSRSTTDWIAALWLCVYAIAFSFAYVSLGASIGALILFGAVQVTMFSAGLRAGERFSTLSWLGFAAALVGFTVLVFPGLSAPQPFAAAWMACAGVAWGLYSLRGRGSTDPLSNTASNFVRALPITLVVSAILWREAHGTVRGIVLALVAGAITSGLGYVIWYSALRRLQATRAATIQLSVPMIAALGSAVFLGETITLRLVLASAAILGGIALVLAQRTHAARIRIR